jgi:transcriptional regulator with XRE-family HTH domain
MNDQPRRASSRRSTFGDDSSPTSPSNAPKPAHRTLADRIRGILATKSLTLYGVAALARLRHPHEPAYHLPPNFYFQLSSAGRTPTIHQLSALSQLSNYRIADWLQLFGFHLDDISRLQASLPRPRTALLDGTVYDAHATIPWFRDRLLRGAAPPVAPLSQLLESAGVRQLQSLFAEGVARFLYAKVGQQDALAFPDLLPGSVVRANPRLVARYLTPTRPRDSTRIFLVKHHGGFCCCRLHFGNRNRITLLPTQLPFAKVEMQLDSQAQIAGVVDLEFRPLAGPTISASPACTLPEVAPELSRLWSPGLLGPNVPATHHVHLLREARLRAGLSLRRASEMSRDVAKALDDNRYFVSQSSLSDYEASDTPPRHVHKLFTLCALYALPPNDLLKSFGIEQMSGATPIPAEWMLREALRTREGQTDAALAKPPARGFLSHILEGLDELPFFLRHSLVSLSGLPELSLHDVFWVGGQPTALHPALAGALFVLVNRRKVSPPAFRRKSVWQQPLYLLMKRDGSYLLANCTLEDKTLVVHPHASDFVAEEHLRLRVDAEVVGQIVAVVRSLLSPH